MDTSTPQTYSLAPWWQVEGEGVAGQALRSWASPEKLEAIIAGRRAAASERMKRIRARSERGIAKLIGQARPIGGRRP
jgi:hypothetical protein